MLGFYNVDLCDKKAMTECFSKVQRTISSNCQSSFRHDLFLYSQHKVDCVMHFAAAKAVAESVREPLKYYSNNVNASTTLLQVG